jgi:hypothetical protein
MQKNQLKLRRASQKFVLKLRSAMKTTGKRRNNEPSSIRSKYVLKRRRKRLLKSSRLALTQRRSNFIRMQPNN